MQKIRLWKVLDNKLNEMESIQKTETELQLENLIVDNPSMIEEDLLLVGRQTNTVSGPSDLLGVDNNGKLVIIELKRGELRREAVAQVLDYASAFNEMIQQDLFKHLETNSGINGIEKIEDFEAWYTDKFSNDFDNICQQPRLMLVGLGADYRTKRMVTYLSESGVDISLITFFAFEGNEGLHFARQVEVESEVETRKTQKLAYNKKNNREYLENLTTSIGVRDYFFDLVDKVGEKLLRAYIYPNKTAIGIYLPEKTNEGNPTNRCYLSFYVWENRMDYIQLFIRNRAIRLVETEFEIFREKYNLKKHRDEGYFIWLNVKEDNENLIQDYLELVSIISLEWNKVQNKS